MANETSHFEPGDANQGLEHLRSDRRTMVARLSGVRWFAPGMGVVVAAFVASPSIPDEAWSNTLSSLALAGSIAILYAYHRTTGIKLSRVGPRAAIVYAAVLAVMLVLLSVSYGLAAGGLSWWIAASAGAAFIAVTWLVQVFITAASKHISHGI